jgi:anaerobic C4-dicarboxylate transporter DcuB
MGITASPIAAAVPVSLPVAQGSYTVTLFHILGVTVPATFSGVLIAALWSINRGKDLDKFVFQVAEGSRFPRPAR